MNEKTQDWWDGVRALAEAVGATADEYGEDLDASCSRLAELLEAVSNGDPPETWIRYAAPPNEDDELES